MLRSLLFQNKIGVKFHVNNFFLTFIEYQTQIFIFWQTFNDFFHISRQNKKKTPET